MAMPGQGHMGPRNQTTTLCIKFNHHIPHPFTGRAGGTKQSRSFVSRCLTTPEQLRQSWQTHCNHLIKHCMQANTQTQHAGEEHCWQARRVSFRWQGPPGAQLSLASHQATQPNHKGGKPFGDTNLMVAHVAMPGQGHMGPRNQTTTKAKPCLQMAWLPKNTPNWKSAGKTLPHVPKPNQNHGPLHITWPLCQPAQDLPGSRALNQSTIYTALCRALWYLRRALLPLGGSKLSMQVK